MEKLDQLFVNPNFSSNKNTPNLCLAHLATHFNAKVIDFNTRPEPFDRIFNYQTNLLGLSIQSRGYHSALEIKNKYQNIYPQTQIKSLNGPLDIQCCYPFINFDEKIDYQEKFSDALPFPNYELFDSFDIFLKNWQTGFWAYTIMTSLGCPYGCTYCAAHNRNWLSRSSENCYQELKQAKDKWRIKSFKILDDCFNFKEDRVIELCNLIKPLNLKWSCVNGLRADKFTEKMAKAMQKSGCRQIGFGVESINNEVLKNINKGETFQQIEKAVEVARKYFKRITGFFIIGLPGSSYEKDLASLAWAKKMRLLPQFSFYQPLNENKFMDSTFYGEKTSIYSTAYPKEQQLLIYQQAQKILKRKDNSLIKKTRALLRYTLRICQKVALRRLID